MSAAKPPPVPDPKAVADAQQTLNYNTMNTALSATMMGQNTPYGTLSYAQTGTGFGGQPTYTATQQFSPTQQNLLNYLQGSQTNASQVGNTMFGGIAGAYGALPDLSNNASSLTTQMMDRQTAYLQPYFDQQNNNLDNQLRNQGLNPGMPAYDNAMRTMRDNQNQSMMSFLNQAEPLAFQQAQQQYLFPIQTASMLAGIGAPTQFGSNFVTTPQGTMQPANYIGAVNNAQQAQQFNYNAQMDQYSGMLKGIFGTASNLMML